MASPTADDMALVVTVRTQLLASYSNAVTGQPKLEGKIVNSLTLQLQHEDAGLGVCTKHSMHIAFWPLCGLLRRMCSRKYS
jgi:hypothetical protein